MDGALFSTGDGHFAQGDGEVCVTAVEMGATCVVRFRVHKGEAARRGIRCPRFAHGDYFADPRWAAPRRFVATMGMPMDAQGVNEGEDLNLACRNALLNMLDLLQERGFSREQAYVIAAWRSTSGSATWWTSRTSSSRRSCRRTSSRADARPGRSSAGQREFARMYRNIVTTLRYREFARAPLPA